MKSSDMIGVLVNLNSGTLGTHPMFPVLGLWHAHNSANPIRDKVELVELLVTTLLSITYQIH